MPLTAREQRFLYRIRATQLQTRIKEATNCNVEIDPASLDAGVIKEIETMLRNACSAIDELINYVENL